MWKITSEVIFIFVSLLVLNNLIDLYEAWNKPEKAEEWRAKLPQTEAIDELFLHRRKI